MGAENERWIVWGPEIADDHTQAYVASAVATFESVGTPAGEAASSWLREQALDNHPSTVTWLMFKGERLQGFYAICSAEILLSERHRKGVLGAEHQIHPRQGASLIAWIGRARNPTSSHAGDALILHAVYTGTRVADLQGNIAIAVDPYDDEVARVWRDRHGFRDSSTSTHPSRPRRLWLPLHAA